MPRIEDLKFKKPTEKFKKVSYRPWDIEPDESLAVSVKPVKVETTIPDIISSIEENFDKELEKALQGLYGVQKNILIFLVGHVHTEDASFCYTKPIVHRELIDYTRSPRASISVCLTRLKTKNLIYSAETKPGRGGFAIYKIPKDLSQYIKKKFPLEQR